MRHYYRPITRLDGILIVDDFLHLDLLYANRWTTWKPIANLKYVIAFAKSSRENAFFYDSFDEKLRILFVRSREQEALEDAFTFILDLLFLPPNGRLRFPGSRLRSLKRSDDSRNCNRFAFRLGTQLESERIVHAIHPSILSREEDLPSSVIINVKRLWQMRTVGVLSEARKIREIDGNRRKWRRFIRN